MPRVYQCIRSHYIVSVKPKHSIRVYLCPSVAQKTKLRKLTERQRKQAIWPRMDTDTHGCGLPASSRSTGRRLEQNCMVMFWRNAILGRVSWATRIGMGTPENTRKHPRKHSNRGDWVYTVSVWKLKMGISVQVVRPREISVQRTGERVRI